MGKSKSFTEYVKIKFEDLIWKEIEKFIESQDVNELDLKLKVVDEVSSIEIDSITVKSVNVANKSEGQIKFDIISEVLLYVRDTMSRYTDVYPIV